MVASILSEKILSRGWKEPMESANANRLELAALQQFVEENPSDTQGSTHLCARQQSVLGDERHAAARLVLV
jgi:hypothetical protein